MNDRNHFQLDGKPVPFEPGQTIMQAAESSGLYIPHLCHHPDLSPHGSCRLCIVDVDGRIQAACTTPARQGAVVSNRSPELQSKRKTIIQMLFTEGNHFCPSCEVSGNCQLQALAYFLDVEDTRFDHQYPARPVDASHPDFFLDRDRCINCALCERASRQTDHKDVFCFEGRGINTHLAINTDDGLLSSSTLKATDKASHICPVGTILQRNRHYLQKPGQRLYDKTDISQIGNHRADDFNAPDQEAPA